MAVATLRTEVDLQAQKLRQSGKECCSAASYNVIHTKRIAHKKEGSVYFVIGVAKSCLNGHGQIRKTVKRKNITYPQMMDIDTGIQ